VAGADLHVHSSASDGRFSPREVMRRAHGVGLDSVALTDHDTLQGNPAAADEAARLGLDFIPGCEISVQTPSVEVHLLAYFVSDHAERVGAIVRRQHAARRDRLVAIVERLRGLGVSITLQDVERHAAAGAAIGRMHVAHALKEAGAVASASEAFSRFLGDEGPAYVLKETASAEEIVSAVWEDGAVPVLAHPGLLPISDLESHFADWELGGIEAEHPSHSPMMRAYLAEWATRRGIPATGGSDWHGDESAREYIGCRRVDGSVVASLRDSRRR